jgi:hypothetical protein
MMPMRTSTIFKSRWMALLWAAGIIWVAYDVAGPSGESTNAANAEQPTDVTGATITDEDARQFEKTVNSL